LQNSRAFVRGEIHVRHPHRDGLVTAGTRPFEAVRVTAVDNPVEINRHAITASRHAHGATSARDAGLCLSALRAFGLASASYSSIIVEMVSKRLQAVVSVPNHVHPLGVFGKQI